MKVKHQISLLLFLAVCSTQAIDIGSFQVEIENVILNGVTPSSTEDKFLNLSSLVLIDISPDAFNNVTYITALELTLSGNFSLPSNVFSALTNLEQLKIKLKIKNNPDGFKIKSNQFFNLKKLKLLDLSESSSLSHVDINALNGLPDSCEVKINSQEYALIGSRDFGINESLQIGYHNEARSLAYLPLFKIAYYSMARSEQMCLNYSKVLSPNTTTVCICYNTPTSQSTDPHYERCSCFTFNSDGPFEFINLRIKKFKINWCRSSNYTNLELVLDCNLIEETDLLNDLPPYISNVHLMNNKIKTIKNDVISNQNIRRLRLDKSEIEMIESRAFVGMSDLRYLSLRENKIENLNFIASLSKNLSVLDLTENEISHLPDNIFSHLSNLKILDLKNNEIKAISGKPFVGLTRLLGLYLSNNLIEKIVKGPFDDVHSLLYLHLSNNKITSIEKGFAQNLNLLRVLYLSMEAGDTNKLSRFDCGTFYGLPALSTVAFSSKNVRSIKVGVFRNVSTDC